MKKLLTLTVVTITLSMLACQDSREDAKNDPQQLAAYKTIGHQIPTETGMRWIETYNEKSNIEGRLTLAGYATSSANLNRLVALPNLVGIAFHHATDNNGAHHFLAIPVGDDLSVWSEDPEKIIIDTNTDAVISQADAADWAGNYKSANPNAIWFHFFGKNVFDAISEIPYLDDMNIVPAINDLDLSPQLLLIIADDSLSGILDRKNTNGTTTVYDASSPCPPCPVN
jgi:hypothetical protein